MALTLEELENDARSLEGQITRMSGALMYVRQKIEEAQKEAKKGKEAEAQPTT